MHSMPYDGWSDFMKASRSCRRVWVVWLSLSWLSAVQAAFAQPASKLPAAWQQAWDHPAPQHRPLQIVHGVNLQSSPREAVGQQGPGSPLQHVARSRMEHYQSLGLGGIVCNVAFQDYLTSPQNWQNLVAVVEACHELSLIVWIYDEQGYPSGAAGGLVLAENPAFEALELAYDAHRDDPFLIRPAYEHTHASNNFYAARRYVNLIDDRAVRCFLGQDARAILAASGARFGNTIQAMFTDEPSLMAVNIGPLSEEVRRKVRVVDPVDPNVEPLPRVPWSYDLPDQYRQRYWEELGGQRRSLFVGSSPEDVRVRRQFWSLVTDLVADRYFGALERWVRGASGRLVGTQPVGRESAASCSAGR